MFGASGRGPVSYTHLDVYKRQGATAVSVGTANFTNPYTTIEVINGIQNYMEKNHIEDIQELIGCVK